MRAIFETIRLKLKGCRLAAAAFLFYADTVCHTFWSRRQKGIVGVLRYPLTLIVKGAQCMSGYFLLGSKVRVIISAYSWFRRIDDVLDGDTDPPWGMNQESYAEYKQTLIDALPHMGTRILAEDVLLEHLLFETSRIGIDVVPEVINLWDTRKWNFNRSGKRLRLVCKDELERYAAMQDECLLSFAVKIFEGDLACLREFTSLSRGVFTRIDRLAGLLYDFKKKIVNIPEEAAVLYGIDVNKLALSHSFEELKGAPGFMGWYVNEAVSVRCLWEITQIKLRGSLTDILPSKPFIWLVVKPIMRAFERDLKRALKNTY